MPTDPKRDADKVEEAGLTAPSIEAPSVAQPKLAELADAAGKKLEVPKPTPSKQDRLALERAAGEGMTAPPSQH